MLNLLDSGFHRNDGKMGKTTFSKTINIGIISRHFFMAVLSTM